ncbi:MAG: NifU family protein [Acholeplasmatales bacterium]|nr:NifU family protein [Acholeplasmatales bacterium]
MEDTKVVNDIKKILNKIRPYLNSEGGDLEFIKFEDGIVYVKMLGACVDCGALDSTLKDGIEALLVENIPEVIEVRNVSEEI